MTKSLFSIALLLPFSLAFGQIDFAKLQQEYMARKPSSDSMRAYPAIPYDSFTVKNDEGTNISCWWLPGKLNIGTVLLVHGFAMNKSMMLPRSAIYFDLGYSIILIDLRARGQSGGNATTSGPGIKSDVIAVIDYYQTHLNDHGPLILAGYSHGGRAVVFAAAERKDKVGAIILESIPYSLSESFKRVYKVNPPPFPEGNLLEALQSLSAIPMLLMIGDKDDAIIPDEGEKIKTTFNNAKSQYILFEGAAHDLTREPFRSHYSQSIKTFLGSLLP